MKTVAEILPEIIEFRHQLHRIPELAGQEFKTQKAIREQLEGLGLEILPPFIGTDTVALLRGGKGAGRNVTIRADIDALKITEETGLEFSSEHPGMMHACGHDGHAAMLVGAAKILASRRDEFAGTVRFVWQPGEENAALGGKLVAAGALENPAPDIVTALHVWQGLRVGAFRSTSSIYCGSCAVFKVTVHGKSGASAGPWNAVNAVMTACAIVDQLQGVVSQRICPNRTASLSVCCFSGGKLPNVIPDVAVFEGTARSESPEDDDVLESSFRQIAEHVASAHGATVEIDYQRRYPVAYNNPEAVELAKRVIRRNFGEDAYSDFKLPALGADDFAYFLQRCPGVYAVVGMGPVKPGCTGAHTSKYVMNDATMEYGIKYFVEFALEALR